MRELIQAHREARQPLLQDVLTACRLTTQGRVCGLASVEISGLHYQPMTRGGQSALILPVWDSHGLIDLVACRLRDRRIATRRGNARALGEEWIEPAIEHCARLPIHSEPIGWLHRGRGGLVILDWPQVPFLLDGVAEVVCDRRALAQRIHDTTRRMGRPPRIHFAQQRSRHAA